MPSRLNCYEGQAGAGQPCMPFLLDCCAKCENNPPCEANRRVRSPGRVTWASGESNHSRRAAKALWRIDLRSNKSAVKNNDGYYACVRPSFRLLFG